jgi:hypothetical protein
MPKSTKSSTKTNAKRNARAAVSTRAATQTDRRVSLLLREQGATPFQTRRAMGYDDGRATTYSKIRELARAHGYKLVTLDDNQRGEVVYKFVARATKPVTKKASVSE